MPSGIIIKGIGGFYYVKTDEGLYECKARGIFRKEDITPLPGDRVKISIMDESCKTGCIDEILPREMQLVRPAVSNINQVAIVMSIKSPSPDLFLADKLLIVSQMKRVDSFLCVNKIDLDIKEEYRFMMKEYEKTGLRVIPVSTRQDIGFHELEEVLKGKITVFAGQSGVGKSTLINRIMNSWVMQTGELSEKIERGKHTTRHVELLELSFGGFIVDTPGFSSFELSEIGHEELEQYYPEFSQYLYSCKFTGCSHISEPGCSIKGALSNGELSLERYNRYIELYNILKANKGYKTKK